MSEQHCSGLGQRRGSPVVIVESRLLQDVLSYIADQARQFREVARHHEHHNHCAESVALRAEKILDRIASDLNSANIALGNSSTKK